jgi:hypothetical protein
MREILGSNFVGAYLQGSFAVGDFDVHSDVDFIIAIKEELADEQIDALQIMHERIYNVDSEWAKHADPGRFNNRFYQAFIVLNYCRMLHDLYRGVLGSKRAGAEWAKRNLDPAWYGLIDRTWSGRPNPAVSVRQPADPEDFQSTLEFVQYIISESSRWQPSEGSEPSEGWAAVL